MDIQINQTPVGTTWYPRHSHRKYEIMHYIRGKGNMWTEHGSIPFSEGTIIIIPPNLLHGSVSEQEFVNISIECDFDGLFALDAPVALSGNVSDEGSQLARMIWENRCGNEAYLHSLCIAYAQYALQQFRIENKMSACVRKIMMQISDQAFNPQINVSGMLQQSGYAEDYIRMCFKRETGKTPLEFLTELRMKHACYLMEVYQNTMTLSEVAEKCGYLDYIYFSKKFKKYMGMSPRRCKGS